MHHTNSADSLLGSGIHGTYGLSNIRIYRIVLAFSVTRDLITVVFRNVVGLLNLILFVFLITYLAAIFAVQLFRGVIPAEDDSGNTIDMTFFTIYNSFLAMYQILSSENWTTILVRRLQTPRLMAPPGSRHHLS